MAKAYIWRWVFEKQANEKKKTPMVLFHSFLSFCVLCRVARTTGYLLYVLHLNACAFYVASVHQGLATTTWVYDGNGTAYVLFTFWLTNSSKLWRTWEEPLSMVLKVNQRVSSSNLFEFIDCLDSAFSQNDRGTEKSDLDYWLLICYFCLG